MRAQRRNVRSELERALHQIGQPALYVIDNIPEAPPGSGPPPIADFCPALGAVAVLATSRQDTREAHVRLIEVDTLDRDPAILLLTDNVLCSAALSWADWGRIAEWVGDLPIALDLLNPCLALGSITPSDLLQRAVGQASRPVRELDRLRDALHGQVPKDAVRGITEAFSISFENLDGPTQQAAQLLAQLDPAPIPEAFMEALPGDLKSPVIRTALRGRHFVTGGGGLSFGVMHRLMVDFLRSAAEASAPELLERACMVLRQVMTSDRCQDPRHWPVMRLCRPHAEALFARGSAMDATAVSSSEMGLAAAFLAFEQGDHAGARRLQQRVLEVRTRVLGEEHPDTLRAMNNLAGTLSAQGDHPGARRLQERVLEAMTRVLGEEHPATLTSMSNLAHTLGEQGDHTGARRLQERVLEARIRLLGEEHRDTLAAKNNLALTLYAQGDYAGAQRLQERVLEASTRLLGEEHPHTLTSMANLALALGAQGGHAGAGQLEQRVLEAMTRVLGEEHPDTLRSMNNLAGTLRAQGDLPAARRHHEHALATMTRVLGEEHPDTLRSMYNLAVTVAAQGDREGALRLVRTCLSGQRKVLGPQHPNTVATAKFLRRLESQPPPPPPSS
jgi:tetratricopeptide (TPR) repeat protein